MMFFRRIRGVVAAALVAAVGVGAVLPAYADDDCTCELPAGMTTVGLISQASADVFVAGVTGRSAATAGTALSVEAVVTTGPAASAQIDLGPACSFAMQASMQVEIIPLPESICVRVTQIKQSVAPDGTVALVAVGGGLALSLGLLHPTSK